MRRQALAIVFTCLMAVSMFAPFAGAAPAPTQTATGGDAIDASIDQTERIDPAPVAQSLENATGTVEVVVRAEEFDVPDASTMSDRAVIQELKAHAEATQEPILDWAKSTDGVNVVNTFWLANAVVLELDTSKVDVKTLAAQKGVTSVHENFEMSLPEPSNGSSAGTSQSVSSAASSTGYDTTYGLDQINASEVWSEFGTMGGGATVAVLDTGVDPDHPDIQIKSENWAEFNDDGERVGSQPHAEGSHGTHTSGTVSGGNASGEYIGVAPNVELMHGLVLPSGSGSFAQIIAGMQWAVEEDADVISMSLGATGYYSQMIDPVRNAQDAGTIVVAAAGNSYQGSSGSPGNVYDSFAIGASNRDGGIAGFSSGEVVDTSEDWGSAAPDDWPETYVVPDVAAPGVNVKSAIPGGGYGEGSGTSMATPHVAGAIALMVSASAGDLSLETIRSTLEETAWKPEGEPNEPDVRYGHGIIDVMAATTRVAADSGVTGTVMNSSGAPVADATVTLGEIPRTTNASGQYTHRALPGTYDMSVEAFGYETATTSVTVEEGNFTQQNFTLSPMVDARTLEGQPNSIEAGESFETTTQVMNVESLTVEASGDYTGDLTLWINGNAANFGQPYEFDGAYSGEVTITVDAASNANKNVKLTHTYMGMGGETELSTGPTYVVGEFTDVAVVDAPSGTYGPVVKTMLDQNAHPRFRFEMVRTDELMGAVGEYDVFVVQNFTRDPELIRNFIDETSSAQTGVVLLDQYATSSNAINLMSKATGDPASAGYGSTTYAADISYHVQRNHPILDGVASKGSSVTISTPAPVLFYAGFHSYFQDYEGVYDGRTLATVGPGVSTSGSGLAVDPFSRTVLASSLGVDSLVPRDAITDDGKQILSNAVKYVSSAPPVVPIDGLPEKIEPGDSVSVKVSAEKLKMVRVAIANSSSYDTNDLSLWVGGEEATFGNWRGYVNPQSGEYNIRVKVHEDAGAAQLSLETTFLTGENKEETTLMSGPTAVYPGDTLDVAKSGGELASISEATDIIEPGGEIVVSGGDYYELEGDSYSPAVTIEKRGVTLRAADNATVNVYYDGSALSVHMVQINAKNIRVDGIRVNVKNGDYDKFASSAIDVNAANATITDVDVAGTYGIMVDSGASGLLVEDARSYSQMVVGTGDQTAVSDVTIRNASVGSSGIFFPAVNMESTDNLTVTGSQFSGLGATGIRAYDSANVMIKDNKMTNFEDAAAISLELMGGPTTVANNTIHGVSGTVGFYPERPAAGIHAASILERNVTIKHNVVTDAAAAIDLAGATATVTHNTLSGERGIHLEAGYGNYPVSSVKKVTYNDLSGADVPFSAESNITDGEYGDVPAASVDVRLNYVGERNGSDTIATVDAPLGDFVYQPYLTEMPSAINASPESTTEIGVDLHLDAGKMYAVGVPGPSSTTISQMFDDDFEGVVYGFDAESQSWTMLTGNDTVDALNAMLVVAETDTRLSMTFQSPESLPGAPGTYELEKGWNFVASPAYTNAEDAFGNYVRDNEPMISMFHAPEGQIGPAGELDGTYMFGSGDAPMLSAFEGYFVFNGKKSSELMPTRFGPDPTMSELYDNLNVSSQFHDGETEDTSVDDILANADEMDRQVAKQHLKRVIYVELKAALADAENPRLALTQTANAILADAPSAQRSLVETSIKAALEQIFVEEFGDDGFGDAQESAVEERKDRQANGTASESVTAPTGIAG